MNVTLPDALVAKLLDGALTAEEMAAFNQELEHDPDGRRRLRELLISRPTPGITALSKRLFTKVEPPKLRLVSDLGS